MRRGDQRPGAPYAGGQSEAVVVVVPARFVAGGIGIGDLLHVGADIEVRVSSIGTAQNVGPIRFIGLKRRGFMGDSCCVYEDVYLAKLFEHSVVQRLERLTILDVTRNTERTPTQRLNLRCNLLYLFQPARTGNHISPRTR